MARLAPLFLFARDILEAPKIRSSDRFWSLTRRSKTSVGLSPQGARQLGGDADEKKGPDAFCGRPFFAAT
jgi:hypothetical protein